MLTFAAAKPPIMKPMYFLLSLLLMTACREAAPEPAPMADPADLALEQVDDTSVRLSWSDRAEGETGYNVFRRTMSDSYYVEPLATLPAGATSFVFTGLTPGETYFFGVQAAGESMKYHSKTVYAPKFTLPVPIDRTKMPVVERAFSTYAYIGVYYTLPVKGAHGICLTSGSGDPTVLDRVFPGPDIPAEGPLFQAIPNPALEAGKTYRLSVYVQDADGYHYSDVQELTLPGEPPALTFNWTRLENPEGVPSSVAVYETTDPLGSRNFHAWYAIADCTGDVQLKVLCPDKATTIDKQAEAAEGCCVLVNGGYFAGSTWKMPYVMDGQVLSPGYGSDKAKDGIWVPSTPSVVGVDASGRPAAYWWISNYGYYYTQPAPFVPGEAGYSGMDQRVFPVPVTDWKPAYAISAGPMVLYDGKTLVDNTTNASGQYVTNYEILASDIFPGNSDNWPDRTAIGYTADGKVVLFICDGRVDESRGASLPELAAIMKGLGCVSAMNLDGGGSTGMMLGNRHLNTWKQGLGSNPANEYRAVYTTVGFFRR